MYQKQSKISEALLSRIIGSCGNSGCVNPE